ncbi:MAG TPA: putative Ig domain-containing protein, partial [Roseiflexaceae bacterium]|nr:putative Ig domain-containing protein [Roseiflexaceae bacterium]
ITAANGVLPNDTQNLTVNVVCPTITLAPAAGSLADGTYQKAYSQVFTASGGGASYAYTRSAGTLPPGMTLASNGTLSGTPTDTGIFNFSVKAANPAGCFGTAAYTLTVRPDAQANSYTGGVGNTQYVVGAAAPATPHVFTSGSILGNDNGPGALSTSLKTAPANGAVVINANGTFVYTPNAGFAGPSDSFEYTLTDGNGITASTTVTVNLGNVVWYVNASGANGDGRSNSPFNSLANAQAPSGNGDTIFVHSAAGNTPGGIVLKTNQTLWGQGTAFTLNSLTIAAGAKPTATGKVVLATGATVSSLIVNVAGDSALTGSSVSGVTTKNSVELVSTGAPAVDLNGVGGTIS